MSRIIQPLCLAGVLAASLAASLPAAAQVDGFFTRSCVGHWGMGNCVVQWRVHPRDPNALSATAQRVEPLSPEAQERDRKWLERCKPVGRQDEYGITRLRYAKPGCEFGKTED
jgi:hypothetical protein